MTPLIAHQPDGVFAAIDARRDPDRFPGDRDLCVFCRTEFADDGFATCTACRERLRALERDCDQPRPGGSASTTPPTRRKEEPMPAKVKCPGCDREFASEQGLKVHRGRTGCGRGLRKCPSPPAPVAAPSTLDPLTTAVVAQAAAEPVPEPVDTCAPPVTSDDAQDISEISNDVPIDTSALIPTDLTIRDLVESVDGTGHTVTVQLTNSLAPDVTALHDAIIAARWELIEVDLKRLDEEYGDMGVFRDRILLFAEARAKAAAYAATRTGA